MQPTDAYRRYATNILTAARAAAADVPGALFGDRKVFLCAVVDSAADVLEHAPSLVAAHQMGLLVLSRADLVSAMDPEMVAKSEIKANGATFHFVNIK